VIDLKQDEAKILTNEIKQKINELMNTTSSNNAIPSTERYIASQLNEWKTVLKLLDDIMAKR
jgi:hypothetical protein